MKEGADLNMLGSSYLLENIQEHYVVSPRNNNQKEEDFSPMAPTNLESRLGKAYFPKSHLFHSPNINLF